MKKTLQLAIVALFINIGIGTSQEYALQFDGDNDYILVPEISELTGTTARTVDCWIKAPAETNSEQVIIQWGQDAANVKWTIRLNEGKILRVEHGAGNKYGTTELNDDTWHHIAVTLPENSALTEAKLYIDGVEEEYTNSAGDVANTDTGDVYIGRALSEYGTVIPTRNWKGLIDELRLWRVALSEEQINNIKDSVICLADYSGLVAYYRFNEGEGTTITDETENGYNGVLGEFADSTDMQPSWVEGYDVEDKECEEEPPPTNVANYSLNSSLNIFPNPAKDLVQISVNAQIDRAIVFDITGKKLLDVYQQDLKILDVSSLKSGVYFVQISSTVTQKLGTFRLIKE